jgi:hypothetical protein
MRRSTVLGLCVGFISDITNRYAEGLPDKSTVAMKPAVWFQVDMLERWSVGVVEGGRDGLLECLSVVGVMECSSVGLVIIVVLVVGVAFIAVECSAVSGVGWSGVEWSGVKWSGVEWSGVEWSAGGGCVRCEWCL